MSSLPVWLPRDLSNPKFEVLGPRFRLKGHANHPDIAVEDFQDVLEHSDPPGYILSRANIEAEHSRGGRLCWEVVWLKAEVAERRYQEKQAARLSRFNQEENHNEV